MGTAERRPQMRALRHAHAVSAGLEPCLLGYGARQSRVGMTTTSCSAIVVAAAHHRVTRHTLVKYAAPCLHTRVLHAAESHVYERRKA